MDSIDQEFLEFVQNEMIALLGLEKFNELPDTDNGYLYLSNRVARLCRNVKRLSRQLYGGKFLELDSKLRRDALSHLIQVEYDSVDLHLNE